MGLGIIRQSLLVLGGNVKWLNEEQIRTDTGSIA
jgi:hypothetical protein